MYHVCGTVTVNQNRSLVMAGWQHKNCTLYINIEVVLMPFENIHSHPSGPMMQTIGR